jgi:hypothetical protein
MWQIKLQGFFLIERPFLYINKSYYGGFAMQKSKLLTPLKAIRAKCLDCCNNQYSEVRYCGVGRCPLYFYRFGKRPKPTVQEEESTQKKEETEQE